LVIYQLPSPAVSRVTQLKPPSKAARDIAFQQDIRDGGLSTHPAAAADTLISPGFPIFPLDHIIFPSLTPVAARAC
jgi:hypothetical protein